MTNGNALATIQSFLKRQGGLSTEPEPEDEGALSIGAGPASQAINNLLAAEDRGDVQPLPGVKTDPSVGQFFSQIPQGFNVGFLTHNPVNVLVDLTAMGLNYILPSSLQIKEPIGGSQNVRRGLAALNMAPNVGEDYTIPYLAKIGEVSGESMAFTMPFLGFVRGGALSMRSPGVGDVTRLQKAGTLTRNIFTDIANTFRTKPIQFAAIEQIGATAAGVGRATANELFPGDPTAQLVGELSFGFSAPYLTIQGAKLTKGMYTSIRTMLPGGAKTKAGEILTKQATNPEESLRILQEGTELDGLTTGQFTNDQGMLALERSLIAHSADLDNEFRAMVTETSRRIEADLRALGPVRPEIAREFLAFRREALLQMIQNKKSQSILTARQKVAELDPNMPSGQRRIEAARIADEELSLAYNAARDTEAKYWLAVDKKEVAGTSILRDGMKKGDHEILGYNQIMALRAKKAAKPDDIPDYVHEHLGQKFDPEDAPRAFGDKEPVGELIDFRKRLLADIRAERGKKPSERNNNKIRILGQLQAGALEEMSLISRSIELGEALDLSRTINDIFTRGPVGKAMNFQPQGFERSPPGSLLDTSLGKGGRQGKDALAKMLAGVELAGRNKDAIRGAAEEFLTDAFLRQAVVDGTVVNAKALKFFEKHGPLLDEFPNLKSLFSDNIRVQKMAQTAQAREAMSTRSLHDKQRSAFALYVDGPPAKAIGRFLEARTPEQGDKLMKSLITAVNKDASGDALIGLKGEFVDQLMAKNQLKPFSQGHDFALDGLGMREFMRSNRRAAGRLMSKEELGRMDDLIDRAVKIQQSFLSRTRADSALEDVPIPLIDTVIRMVGAKFGSAMRRFLMGGASVGESLIATQAGSRMARRALEKVPSAKVEMLLRESVFNKELAETLLSVPTSTNVRDLRRQMYSFLLGISSEKEVRILEGDAPIMGGA